MKSLLALLAFCALLVSAPAHQSTILALSQTPPMTIPAPDDLRVQLISKEEFESAERDAVAPPGPSFEAMFDDYPNRVNRLSAPGNARLAGSDVHYTAWFFGGADVDAHQWQDGLLLRAECFDQSGAALQTSYYTYHFVPGALHLVVEFVQPEGAETYRITLVLPRLHEKIETPKWKFGRFVIGDQAGRKFHSEPQNPQPASPPADPSTDTKTIPLATDGHHAALSKSEFEQAETEATVPPQAGMTRITEGIDGKIFCFSKVGKARIEGSDTHYTWWLYRAADMKGLDQTYDGLLLRSQPFEASGAKLTATYMKFVYVPGVRDLTFDIPQPPGATSVVLTFVHPGARQKVESTRHVFLFANPPGGSTASEGQEAPLSTKEIRYERSDYLPSTYPETWYVFVPKPPDLPSQRVTDVSIWIDGKPMTPELVRDAVGHRLVYRVVVPGSSLAAGNRLDIQVLYRGTFGEYGAKEELTAVDRARFTEPEGFDVHGVDYGVCDFNSAAFQSFLDQADLHKGAGETDHAFASRALRYCDTNYRYVHPAGDCHVSATLQTGRAECGGWAALLASILRANHVPARVLGGVRMDGEQHVVSDFYDSEAGRWVQLEVTGTHGEPYFDRWQKPMFVTDLGSAFRLEWNKGSYVTREFIQGATEAYHSVGSDGFRADERWSIQ